MALKDVLKTPPVSPTGYRSRIDVWRDGLDDADRRAFDAALRNPEWTSTALARTLKPEGLDIGDSALRAYRQKVAG
ncbi:hypothetical protein J2Y69_003086 [Microbacterium resistens]|uniref:Uncharacterized protein n=1 Tax=Microbacterium resistens TaxID=156977 RepID=A0ABU1SFT4_9MICO|nr:hypothetical protein [Microbacterium resistens]MDR6868470.1 hypothetical protein [Microbacterium resistens]